VNTRKALTAMSTVDESRDDREISAGTTRVRQICGVVAQIAGAVAAVAAAVEAIVHIL
jgi:hypothetical protein